MYWARSIASVKCFVGALVFVSVQGCAIFSSGPNDDDGNAFRSPVNVTSPNNPVPLPLEIAADIAVLAAGGQVSPVSPVTIPEPQRAPSSSRPDQTQSAAPAPTAGPAPAQAPVAAVEGGNAASVDRPLVENETLKNCRCENEDQTKSGRRARKGRRPSSGQKKSDEVYIVKDGDTLMKISFEKYGNVYRWREIYNANQTKIANYNRLVAGTVLRILGVEYIVIERNGQPYLIKKDDTLVKISRGLYGSARYWRNLWDNNRQLIHDPNKIYAGFTLYYLPADGYPPVRVGENRRIKAGPLRSRLPAAKK